MSGLELLETIKRDVDTQGLRVVVYTGRDLTAEEKARLEEMSETTIVKDVRSLEHLVDKTALFLHRVEADLRPATRQMLHQVQAVDPDLAGKKVLIVDDDLRNIFALTSKLERWEMVVLQGRERQAGPGVAAADAGRRRRPDGHHDARDGRLRDDAGDPRASTGSGRCRSSR